MQGAARSSVALLRSPIMRVEQRGDRYAVRDLTVDIRCYGVTGDRSAAEHIMRNAARALAVEPGATELEQLALSMARYCSTRAGEPARVVAEVRQQRWGRLEIGGRPRDADLIRVSGPVRFARVTMQGGRERIGAGFRGMRLMTPRHADRNIIELLRLDALWFYGWSEVPYDTQWQQVQRALTEAYAETTGSRSELAAAMASAILAQSPAVADLRLRIGRLRRRAVDMNAFGLENTGELYGDVLQGEYVEEIRATRGELPA